MEDIFKGVLILILSLILTLIAIQGHYVSRIAVVAEKIAEYGGAGCG